VVTLVGCGADDGVPACAYASLAGVGPRADVVVGARAPKIGRASCRRDGRPVAGPRGVKLDGGGADDGGPARAYAALAGVGARAGVAVGARAPMGHEGIR